MGGWVVPIVQSTVCTAKCSTNKRHKNRLYVYMWQMYTDQVLIVVSMLSDSQLNSMDILYWCKLTFLLEFWSAYLIQFESETLLTRALKSVI